MYRAPDTFRPPLLGRYVYGLVRWHNCQLQNYAIVSAENKANALQYRMCYECHSIRKTATPHSLDPASGSHSHGKR